MNTFLDGNIILGDKYAQNIRETVNEEVTLLKQKNIVPCLAVILVGSDPASKIYVANKHKFAISCGMKSVEILLGSDVSEFELLLQIEALNCDPEIHGILVQMPLPKHINSHNVIKKINPKKDVDGFHPINMGALLTGTTNQNSLLPCTPLGCMYILESLLPFLETPTIRGKNAVIIGSSNIVGKPIAAMLVNKGATVSVLNSATQDRKHYTKKADILITACGVPNLITGEDISTPIILDVGINRLPDGTITGDCDFSSCKQKAKFITPVPKGIGPMTISMLLRNTILATKSQLNM